MTGICFFFDALLEYIQKVKNIDQNRIYIMGHSNGGLFTYELWNARPEKITAICIISAVVPFVNDRQNLTPVSAVFVAGRKDRLVKFDWQKESFEFVKKLNKCELYGCKRNQKVTLYKSDIGCDVETYISNGGHSIPSGSIPFIMDFFKNRTKKYKM